MRDSCPHCVSICPDDRVAAFNSLICALFFFQLWLSLRPNESGYAFGSGIVGNQIYELRIATRTRVCGLYRSLLYNYSKHEQFVFWVIFRFKQRTNRFWSFRILRQICLRVNILIAPIRSTDMKDYRCSNLLFNNRMCAAPQMEMSQFGPCECWLCALFFWIEKIIQNFFLWENDWSRSSHCVGVYSVNIFTFCCVHRTNFEWYFRNGMIAVCRLSISHRINDFTVHSFIFYERKL